MSNISTNKSARPFWVKVVLNLLAMLAICIGLFLIAAYWLDLWTHHGSEITVPDVKGMTFKEAQTLLEDEDFEVILQDSVYEDKIKPGVVVEQSPTGMAVVKPGRTVYLTINAFYPRTIPLPMLIDISERQALTTLEGIGFKNVTVHQVPSEFDGLVFGVIVNGKRLKAGARVPLTAKIVLEVGMSQQSVSSVADSISPEVVATDAVESAETSASSNPAEPEATITTTTGSEPSADDENDLFD